MERLERGDEEAAVIIPSLVLVVVGLKVHNWFLFYVPIAVIAMYIIIRLIVRDDAELDKAPVDAEVQQGQKSEENVSEEPKSGSEGGKHGVS